MCIYSKNSGSYSGASPDGIENGEFSGGIGNQKSVDLNLVFGGDMSFQTGARRIHIDFRYTLGCGDVFEDVDDPHLIPEDEFPLMDPGTYEGERFRNGVFTFAVGISL